MYKPRVSTLQLNPNSQLQTPNSPIEYISLPSPINLILQHGIQDTDQEYQTRLYLHYR